MRSFCHDSIGPWSPVTHRIRTVACLLPWICDHANTEELQSTPQTAGRATSHPQPGLSRAQHSLLPWDGPTPAEVCTDASTPATQTAAHQYTFQQGNWHIVTVTGGKIFLSALPVGRWWGLCPSISIMRCLTVFLFGR